MTTPAYTPFNSSVPNAAESPTSAETDTLNNLRALRDAVVCGFAPGNFAYSQNGGTNSAPTNRVWADAVTGLQFRMVAVVYDATIPWMPTSVKWQWSNDSGTSWADLDATATTITWATASNYLVITAVSRDAGAWIFALQGLVAVTQTHTKFLEHASLTGSSAHGLGTISTQNANAVAITGGTIKGVPLGGTGASEAQVATVTIARETFQDAGTVNSVTLDCNYGLWRVQSAGGALNIAFSNPAPSGFVSAMVIEAVNWGAASSRTFPTGSKWAGAAVPTFTASGTDLVRVYTRDGGTTWRWALIDKDTR
jgi:hypothetical protein